MKILLSLLFLIVLIQISFGARDSSDDKKHGDGKKNSGKDKDGSDKNSKKNNIKCKDDYQK